jgi:hypothetical protein
VIVAPGPGAAPTIQVLDGNTGAVVSKLDIFEATFTGGLFVAAADFNGDGFDDIVVSPDQSGGPRVRVLSGKDNSTVADFFGIADTNFRGGARVAVGDVNGDARPDLIVAAGFGGGPRIAIFNGRTLPNNPNPDRLIGDFFAFESTLRNGAFVAVGDLQSDGFSDLVFGGGPGGGPRVMAISSKSLLSNGAEAAINAPIANFFAGDANQRNGITVGVGDPDAAGRSLILTGLPGGTVGAYTINGSAFNWAGVGGTGTFIASTPIRGLTPGVPTVPGTPTSPGVPTSPGSPTSPTSPGSPTSPTSPDATSLASSSSFSHL